MRILTQMKQISLSAGNQKNCTVVNQTFMAEIKYLQFKVKYLQIKADIISVYRQNRISTKKLRLTFQIMH